MAEACKLITLDEVKQLIAEKYGVTPEDVKAWNNQFIVKEKKHESD